MDDRWPCGGLNGAVAQQCAADGLWYDCSCHDCTFTRSCLSNRNLSACACGLGLQPSAALPSHVSTWRTLLANVLLSMVSWLQPSSPTTDQLRNAVDRAQARSERLQLRLDGLRSPPPRVLYIVLSSNSSSGKSKLAALQRGWLRIPSASDVHISLAKQQTLQRATASKLVGSLSGTRVFDAIREAHSLHGASSWVMIGDDDTHVDPHAVAEFARDADLQQATISSDLQQATVGRRVFGNLYAFGRSSAKERGFTCNSARGRAPFRLRTSWYTGGSGVLMSQAVASRIIHASRADLAAWAAVSKECRCFDVPLACALADMGVSAAHRPERFLDSCSSCAAFLDTAPRQARDSPQPASQQAPCIILICSILHTVHLFTLLRPSQKSLIAVHAQRHGCARTARVPPLLRFSRATHRRPSTP